MTYGRFDDFTMKSSREFLSADDVIVADTLNQVIPALAKVDEAARRGQWCFGFVAYEAAAAFDAKFVTHERVQGLPLVWFAVAGSAPPRRIPIMRPSVGRSFHITPWQNQWSAEQYIDRVRTVQERIATGETYQCNLTSQLTANFSGDPLAFYGDLAHAQRGAHNALIDTGRHVIASASPELFFELSDRRLLMRPMKGTASRGRTRWEDRRNAAHLLANEKERAENIMIVDLMRNDASRIAVPGSVSVPRLLRVEKYPTVFQLTSDVVARVPRTVGVADIFSALFPCGSITGAPKHSSMSLIHELESGPRGVYCGAIGVVGPTSPGDIHASFSVAIRTAVIDRSTGETHYGTGSGITWGSSPDAEYQETQLKAAILDSLLVKSEAAAEAPKSISESVNIGNPAIAPVAGNQLVRTYAV